MIIQIYGLEGEPRDWDWLKENFGPLVLHPAFPDLAGWRLVRIDAREGPAAIICKFVDADGRPVPNLPVAWYWPDADPDPNCGPANGQPAGMKPNICDHPVGVTNAEGIIGHPMGGGAYYKPWDGERGPHATWGYGATTNSDLVLGLGMVFGTNHRHLDLTFQHTDSQPEPPPCPWEQINAYLDAIEELIAAIRALQEAAEHATQ